ncbi:endonuclease domain-containing 1 protein-like [Takifugu rubripes]|uniref:Endonuclease domain-containing 1 protein-like n=1 Tax=Takifugu rubripes TaxID=31033 RepID=A0A674NIN2_TAKRU|nr:endonuclease domain-containing 1 protein-like [Takifugu rubripes]
MGNQFAPSADQKKQSSLRDRCCDRLVPGCSAVVKDVIKPKRRNPFFMIKPTSGMCALAFLALMSCALLQGVQARVVEEFSHADSCKDSLYMGTPPRGFISSSLRKICQRYGNKPRYVTLYDASKHIPVYSGYTFKKSDGEMRVDVPWMFEPQLASPKSSSNMEPFLTTLNPHMNIDDTQAVLEDYANTVQYERGQLNPAVHQADQLDKVATYTLTNVVPQSKEFKTGSWAKYLDLIRRRLNNYCQGTAYVVTGVTTTGHTIHRKNVDRITVPEYLWSAYCCTKFDQNAPYTERYKFPTFAAYGLNNRANNHVVEVSLQNLEAFIKERMEVDNLQIFYDNCMI